MSRAVDQPLHLTTQNETENMFNDYILRLLCFTLYSEALSDMQSSGWFEVRRRALIGQSAATQNIDVDQFNEDTYKDEDQGELTSPNVGPDEKEVSSLMSQLMQQKSVCCREIVPPLILMNVNSKSRQPEMEQAIESLDRDLLDTLMKYIYRGFEFPSEGSSGHLLAWYEKVFAVGGVGSIVRVLTDRKRV
ncbi:Actin-related protein 2/3 complex subunit 5 [Nymphon striatum]|nr:Actin-related protein 2/3 complex subunit 5 [Nymphon striatum]